MSTALHTATIATTTGIYDYQSNYELEYHRESERADSERDRADGAEAHLRALLVEYVIEPKIPVGYPEMSEHAAFEIAESLIADLNGGTKVENLDPSGLIQGWVEGLR